jgi:hypothetical protein
MIHRIVELTSGHPSQKLTARGDAALLVEELLDFGVHGEDHRSRAIEAVAPGPSPVDE